MDRGAADLGRPIAAGAIVVGRNIELATWVLSRSRRANSSAFDRLSPRNRSLRVLVSVAMLIPYQCPVYLQKISPLKEGGLTALRVIVTAKNQSLAQGLRIDPRLSTPHFHILSAALADQQLFVGY